MDQNPQMAGSESRAAEIDTNVWKLVVFSALTITSSISTFFFWNAFLVGGASEHILWTLLAGAVLLSFSTLNVFFFKNFFFLKLLTAIGSIAPLSVFYSHLYPSPSLALLAGAFVFLVFSVNASRLAYRRAAESMKVRFWEISRIMMPRFMTGLLVFLLAVSYVSFVEWGTAHEALGEKLIREVFAASGFVVKIWLPDFSFDKTVGELFTMIAEFQLKKISSGDSLNFGMRLTPQVYAQMVRQAADELQKAIEQSVGPLVSDERVGDAAYRLVSHFISSLSPEGKMIFNGMVIILLFFLLRGLAIPFGWLVSIFSFIIFRFLLAVNFAYVNLETKRREFVALS